MASDDISTLPGVKKGREAFRTISEVADYLDLPQHVLRFWESKFAQIKPLKRGGNRRYYRPDDVALLTAIKKLLHSDGYTIRGVQKLFKAQGVKATMQLALGEIDYIPSPADSELPDDTLDHGDDMPVGLSAQAGLPKDSRAGLVAVINRLKQARASLA